uniref:Uncharacterized protein n=1 Tax=Arundo donax TaxID=35708 RepID=A0A0A8ZKI9_ARUDO
MELLSKLICAKAKKISKR